MKFRTILLATACGLAVPVAATAAGPTPAPAGPLQVGKPSVKVVPVFQVTPPNQLPPANELPTAPFAVGLYSAILAQANDSNELPTSPPPPQSALPSCSGYQLNKYSWYWPSVTQSQTWWAAQPGAPAKGSEAYTIGIAISHQQQEGWQVTGGCVADPEPACGGTGYTNSYSWGGQFTGWTGSCLYHPEPACTGTGITSSYYWTGSAWAGGCTYHPEPTCPGSMIANYTWTGSTWSGACDEPAQPPCPAGDGGSYTWYGYPYYTWHDGCTALVTPPSSGGGGGGSGGSSSTGGSSSSSGGGGGGSSSGGGGGVSSSGGGGSPGSGAISQGYLYYETGNAHGGGGGLFPQWVQVNGTQFSCSLGYGFVRSGTYQSLPLASLNTSSSSARTNDLSDLARYCGIE